MNSRQFAAAHDRYLDPPDEEDEDDIPDEDALQDIARQRRLDEAGMKRQLDAAWQKIAMLKGKLAAKDAEIATLRNAINYPAEWDTAVYPTMLSALQEIYACDSTTLQTETGGLK